MDGDNMRYGCVFCKTGHETSVAKRIAKQWKHVQATPVYQIRHKSLNGVRTHEKAILLPSYVMLKINQYIQVNELACIPNVLRILRESGQDWWLHGENLQFAEWVFQTNGVIGVSEARKANGMISICSGPLKDYEDSIIRLDRHDRNGLVNFNFDGKSFRVWLAFEVR